MTGSGRFVDSCFVGFPFDRSDYCAWYQFCFLPRFTRFAEVNSVFFLKNIEKLKRGGEYREWTYYPIY